MPNPNTGTSPLYDMWRDLKNKGYFQKDWSTFAQAWTTPGEEGYKIRKSIYDDLHSKGYLQSPTYEEFMRKSGSYRQQPQRPAQPQAMLNTPQTGRKPQQVVTQQTGSTPAGNVSRVTSGMRGGTPIAQAANRAASEMRIASGAARKPQQVAPAVQAAYDWASNTHLQAGQYQGQPSFAKTQEQRDFEQHLDEQREQRQYAEANRQARQQQGVTSQRASQALHTDLQNNVGGQMPEEEAELSPAEQQAQYLRDIADAMPSTGATPLEETLAKVRMQTGAMDSWLQERRDNETPEQAGWRRHLEALANRDKRERREAEEAVRIQDMARELPEFVRNDRENWDERTREFEQGIYDFNRSLDDLQTEEVMRRFGVSRGVAEAIAGFGNTVFGAARSLVGHTTGTQDADAARRLMEQAIDRMEASNNGSGFWRGLYNVGKRFSNWDFGISDANDAILISAALAKHDRGERLTAGEEALLKAAAFKNAIDASYETGSGYSIGESTAESIPFVLEMIATAGLSAAAVAGAKGLLRKGFGKAATKGATKAATREAAAEAATEAAAGAATRGMAARAADIVRKGTSGALTTGVAGLTQTATVGLPKVVAGAVQRHTGDVSMSRDAQGNTIFSHVGGEDWLKSAVKAWLQNFYEYGSENAGEALIEPLLKLLGRGMKAGVGNIGAALVKDLPTTKPVSYAASKAAVGKLDFGGLLRTVDAYRKAAKVEGILPEYLEELTNSIADALTIGDQKIVGSDGKVFGSSDEAAVFNWENQLNTALALLPMQIGFGGASVAGHVRQRVKTSSGLRRATAFMEDRLGKDAAAVKQAIDAASDENLAATVAQAVRGESPDAARSIVNYAAWKAAYDTVRLVDRKRATESEEQLSTQDIIDEAYADGHAAVSDDERRQMFFARQDARENLMNVLEAGNEEAMERAVAEYENGAAGMYEEALADGDALLADAALRYANAEQAWQGVLDGVKESAADAQEADGQRIDAMAQDGTLHPVVLKSGDENTQGEVVYVVSGNVAGDESGIDADASDKMLIIAHENGEKETIAPDAVASVLPTQDAAQVKEERAREITDNAVSTFTQMIEAEVQQQEQEPQPAEQEQRQYGLGDKLTLRTQQGDVPATIVRQADPDGRMLVRVDYPDGERVAPYTAEQLDGMVVEAPQETAMPSQGMEEGQEPQQPAGQAPQQPAGQAPQEPVEPQAPQEPTEVPAGAGQEAQSPQAPQAAGEPFSPLSEIPSITKGKKVVKQYHKVPVERTLQDLYDGTLDQASVDAYVQAQIDEAQRDAKQAAEKTVPVTTDLDAYKAAVAANKAQQADAEERAAYWSQVRDEVQRITKREGAESDDLLPVGDMEMDAYEYVASQFGDKGGIKITPESFYKETGYSGGEARKMTGVLAKAENGGVSIERAAEIIAERASGEGYTTAFGSEFFENDSSKIRDIILDILQEGNPRSYISRHREERARKMREAMENDRDTFCQEAFHMSYEEYREYESQLIPSYIEKYRNFDAQKFDELRAEADAERTRQLNEIYNDGTREGTGNGGSGEVLPAEGTADGAGSEIGNQRGAEADAGREGAAATGAVPEGAPAGEVEAQVSEPQPVESTPALSANEQGNVAENAKASSPNAKASRGNERASRRVERAFSFVEKALDELGIDKDEIHVVTDASQLPSTEGEALHAITQGRRVMGWYNPTTNEVYLYAPNARNKSEVKRTLLHELVSHKGLRGLLGNEGFDKLCDDVWDAMSARDKWRMIAYILKKDANAHISLMEYAEAVGKENMRREAADEYMAHLSERGIGASVWERIRNAIVEALRKLGFDMQLTDADIRKLLRESYGALTEGRSNWEAVGGSSMFSIKNDEETGENTALELETEAKPASKEEKKIVKELAELLNAMGVETSTDWKKGQRVLDAYRELAKLMGSRVENRKKQIASELKGRELTKEQQVVVDVFTGRKNNLPLEITDKDGKVRRIVLRQGNEQDAGTKHSIYRHYGTTEGVFTAEEVLVIPNVLANGVRKPTRRGKTQLYEYTLKDENGIEYTVLTERNAGREAFVDFYTNKKSPAARKTRSEEARASDTDDSGAKIRKDAETAIENAEKLREMRAYHGSGADFDAFDHSHMGEGEGVQAYGWGTYVTEVEGIGRTYAKSIGTKDAQVMMNGVPIRDVLGNNDYWDNAFSWFISGSEKTLDELRDKISYAYIDGRIASPRSKRAKEFEKQKARLLQALDNGEIEIENSATPTLYTVEIPEGDESNYLEYSGKAIDRKEIERIGNALKEKSIDIESADSWIKNVYGEPLEVVYGEDLYSELAKRLGSMKAASEFLHGLGYTGIKYPAQYTSGGRSDGASNYVIFDENDLQITDKIKFFRTDDGEVYGFTLGGKIYLDPRVATSETPIHEYAHLWSEALEQANPQAWQQLKDELTKDAELLNFVKGLYPNIEDDNELMHEVFSRFAGRQGKARLDELLQDEMAKADGILNKARIGAMFHRLAELLNKYWDMARDLFAGKVEGLENKTKEDFADMLMNDLLRGFNPNAEKSDIRTQNFKNWFGDWENDPANASKVVDENGEPLVVYHGDRQKGRYVFGVNTFFSPSKEYAKRYAPEGGEVEAYYLDIKKPFDIRNKEAYDIFTVYRGGHAPAKTASGAMDWAEYDYDDLQEYLNERYPGEYDGFVLDEGADGGYGAEVQSRGLSYVPFEATQIKSATNNNGEYSRQNKDVRFRITPAKDKTLMAVHNISAEKLKKAIKQGGLANPSMAVIDTNNGMHKDYGEISLIPKAALLENTGRRGGVYAGDAWSPTYPNVSRFLTDKGDKHRMEIARAVADGDEGLMWHLASRIADYVKGNADRLHWLFLKQKGLNPEIKTERTAHTKEEYDAIVKIFGKPMTNLPNRESGEMTKEQNDALVELMVSEYEREMREGVTKSDEKVENFIRNYVENYRKNLVDDDGWIWFAKGDTYINDNWRDERRRENPQVDWHDTDNEASNRVALEGLSGEYEQWKENLLDADDVEEKIFVGYTPAGNRRYVPNTLENVSRIMNKEEATNAYGNGGVSALRAMLLDKFTSLAQIRKNRGRLQVGDEVRAKLEEASDELFDIINQISERQKIDDNPFINVDYAERRLQEAIVKSDPVGYLNREFGYNIAEDSELAAQIRNFKEAVKKLPVKYFEAKFTRPVRLDEFAVAVVPENTDSAVKEALENAGIDVREYDGTEEGREAATRAAVDERGDIRFRISDGEAAEEQLRFRIVDGIFKTAELEAQPKVKVFRAMQQRDGKLYPPMAGRVNGQWQQPIELGRWEQADEHPELVDDKGKFKLDKGNGSNPMPVAYNPYIHTSRSPLNDQFASAWSRPELVTVEVEVPASELTSGYKADKAKDAVGEVDWKSGSVSGKLAKNGNPRKVILSRYDKPLRVVPNDEVAARIAEMLEGTGIEIPFNTVTPELRDALVEHGVTIGEPENNNAGKAAKAAYDVWQDGIRFSIIGERGAARLDSAEERTHRIENLDIARNMEAAGKDSEAIRWATGWERGADGLWRYEIDDVTRDAVYNGMRMPIREAQKKIQKLRSLGDAQMMEYYRLSGSIPKRLDSRYTEEEKAKYRKLRKERDAYWAKANEYDNEERRLSEDYERNGYETTLGDILGAENPIMKAYPELSDVRVMLKKTLRDGAAGSYDKKEKLLEVGIGTAEDAVPVSAVYSTFLHELQHAIQYEEGFARGGNLSSILSDKEKMQEIKDDMNRLLEEERSRLEALEGILNETDAQELSDLAELEGKNVDDMLAGTRSERARTLLNIKNIKGKLSDLNNHRIDYETARDYYHRIAGEVEARNVQKRIGLSADERRASLLTDTEDVARDDQVFLWGDEGGNLRFSISNANQRVFVSNAEKAVEQIKQEKATPAQWLAMVQKQGGLKTGEDKWLGLSEWLQGSDAKTLTKGEVLDYIREHQIEIEEVQYSEESNVDSNERMRELREEFDALLNEGADATNSIYTSDWADWALNEMVERYGDDFRLGFYWNKDANGYPVLEANSDYDGVIDGFARYYLGIEEQPINSTRLLYTTEGLENKREIALTVPTIESWNEGDEVHFSDAGDGRAVAWIRFGDTTDADGNRVLVIDEIQSKRHQQGREKGYRKYTDEDIDEAFDKWQAFKRRMKKEWGEGIIGNYENWPEVPESVREEIRQASAEYDAVTGDAGRVPDAPFDKNWQELAMKRMLRYAAENGYDKVAWTTGEQQAERYDLSDIIDHISYTELPDGGIDARAYFDNGSYQPIGKTWEEVRQNVGKDMASRMQQGESTSTETLEWGIGANNEPINRDYKVIDGENLRIGGEGMKGFYDQILPRFMDKYGKKWGIKTGMIELPQLEESAQKMWAVDVTPEMKQSVMQGQPMFSIKGDEGFRAPEREEGESIFDYAARVDAAQREWRAARAAEKEPEAEIEQAFNDLAGRYNSKPYVFVNPSADVDTLWEQLEMERTLVDSGLFAQEELSEIDAEDKKAFLNGIVDDEKRKAYYNPFTDKIYIFAPRVSRNDAEEIFFHENVHGALQDTYGFDKRPVAEHYWDAPKVGEETATKAFITKNYPERLRKEEYFTRRLGKAMANGTIDDVLASFDDPKDIETIQEILKQIGYDREEEIRRRAQASNQAETQSGLRADGLQPSSSLGENPAGERGDGGNVRFRIEGARDAYEKALKRSAYQFTEAVQDSMLSLKKLYQAILAEGRKLGSVRIEDVEGYENAYLAENRLASATQAQQEEWHRRFMTPLLEAVNTLTGNDKKARTELADYMMAKHGLERNRIMAERDAQKEYDKKVAEGENPNLQDLIRKYRKRDYAGLTALTGETDVKVAEAAAQLMVDDYEGWHDTTELWQAVNAATKSSLEKTFLSGMMSRERYEQVRDMYEYYIPLQGFEEKTSDEVYAYFGGDGTTQYGAPIRTARGRKSKADDPIATIQMNGEAAIRLGNRNQMKMAFLTFVQSHPSDLVSVNDVWLRYNDATDEWELFDESGIQPGDDGATIARKIEEFNERMEQLAKSDPDHYKRGKDAPHVPYRVLGERMKEHQVLVRMGDRTYILTINGNPRAAQALNGLTNPDVDDKSSIGSFVDLGQRINRQLSAFYTTRNPEFVVSNGIRDLLYSNCMTWVKESPAYALKFHKNFAKMNAAYMAHLITRWENGTLDDSKYYQRMFKQFMLNGGETGFQSLRNIEKHKKEVEAEMKRMNSTSRKAWRGLGLCFEVMNRSVENWARFAAFVTSREAGRSIERSIWDAKEVSVNFNKKGAGDKFLKAEGQTWIGNLGAYVGGFGKALYVFFNAGVQGMNNIVRAAKRHPAKLGLGILSTNFALGAAIPLIMEAVFGGDDDDKDSYYNLPEYVRRSNICFRWKKDMPWVTIPLPIEFRALYGLGELATSYITGKEQYDTDELTQRVVSQISQVLPLDFMEGGGGLHALIPSFVKPVVEAYTNKSWSGLPVYRNNVFKPYAPQWTLAYDSTNKMLVNGTKWLNEATGGDDYTQGYIDWNPARIQYMLNGYFGGWSTMTQKMLNIVELISGERDFAWRDIPIASRVLHRGDERTEARQLKNRYFKLKEEYDKITPRLRGYEKEVESDDDVRALEYAERLDFLNHSPQYARYQIFDAFKPMIDSLEEEKEAGGDKEALDAKETAIYRIIVGLSESVSSNSSENDAVSSQIDAALADWYRNNGDEKKRVVSSYKRLYDLKKYSRFDTSDGNAKPETVRAHETYKRICTLDDIKEDMAIQAEIQQSKNSGDIARHDAIDAEWQKLNKIVIGQYKEDNYTEEALGAKNADADERIMRKYRTMRSKILMDFGIRPYNW